MGLQNFNGDLFIFASEDGTIDGWQGSGRLRSMFSGPTRSTRASPSPPPTVRSSQRISIAARSTSSTQRPHRTFTDPAAPAGYAPFNIQNLGGKLFVTFAQQDATGHDDVPGVGHGLVDVFDPVTHTFTRLITGSAAGGTVDALNSPWGMALAPSGFGKFGGDLLVGNFGDGTINAFDPTTGAFLGTLSDKFGNPLVNPGLWGLTFGNGGSGGDKNTLYFTAGGADEASGVFGQINAVPEPRSLASG